MKLLKDGGFLATCSCSHFMTYELFTQTIRQAAKNVHKRLRLVEYRHQAPDHPILWAAEESYYLKFYIFQVMNQPLCGDKKRMKGFFFLRDGRLCEPMADVNRRM